MATSSITKDFIVKDSQAYSKLLQEIELKNNKKFTIPIVWHNCYDCPPEESWNERLWVTDGKNVFTITYEENNGWYNKETGDYLPFELIWKYWWADLEQTIRNYKNFLS